MVRDQSEISTTESAPLCSTLFNTWRTTVTYETRRLADLEFPTYFSLSPLPGYNLTYLSELGIRGEAALFDGHLVQLENETDSRWTWGGVNSSIQG